MVGRASGDFAKNFLELQKFFKMKKVTGHQIVEESHFRRFVQ